jgi:hypothetical protein
VVIALNYVDRLLMINQDIILTYPNAKNITFTALTLAAKFYDDRFERNTLFSTIAKITRKQMK